MPETWSRGEASLRVVFGVKREKSTHLDSLFKTVIGNSEWSYLGAWVLWVVVVLQGEREKDRQFILKC